MRFWLAATLTTAVLPLPPRAPVLRATSVPFVTVVAPVVVLLPEMKSVPPAVSAVDPW